MEKKKILAILIILILTIGLLTLTGCGNNENTESISNNSENKESVNDGSMENNNFILKDHKGYYNETKDKYIVEGTIVNKTDKTLEDKYVMIRLYSEDEKLISVAECLVEKIEPHAEIKIIANTPTLSENAGEIVKYVLSSL